ncbi:MAG: hypothetical protein HQ557_05060 [Bacteroidetes bacterium]|nr:hypothetical protein [Bacteroidota bacterium]
MVKKIIFCLIILLLAVPSALFSQDELTALPENEKRPLIDLTPIQDYLMGPDGYQLLSTTHDILGYSAVLIGLTAGLLSPDVLGDDVHGALGTAASAAAALNIGIGFLNYGDRLNTGNGLFTIDNIHIVLGITGGVLMIAATLLGESDAHPIMAGLGTAMMGAGIILQL